MKELFQNLDGKYKVVSLSIFTILVLSLIGLMVSNVTDLIILVIALITVFYVTVLVLLNKTNNSIRYFSLFIIFTMPILILPPIANPLMKFINAFITNYFPNYINQQPVNEISSLLYISILMIVLIGVFIVNYFMAKEDSTAMKVHPRLSHLSEILDRDFIVKMVNISNAFSDDIERLDRQFNWSSNYFTPLDAEVLVKTEKEDKRKITDLLTAIKNSKDRLFLLLGEPGSGKSVALRKLAKELSLETQKTGKIPIYINLKEWSFSEESKITVEDLKAFIVSYIKQGSEPIIKQFFFKELEDGETIFDKLHEYGHIYYLFDSFDEIPQVINSKEDTKLITNLSEVLNVFLTGARIEDSQGIVASRIYKKPSESFLSQTILEIRPFNENKIIQTLETIGYRQDDLIKKLFTTRPDLVQIAKNPFSAMLIARYAEKHQHKLPENQSELFKVFLDNALDEIKEEIENRHIDKKKIIECSIYIASIMFSQDKGLGISVEILQKLLPDYDIENIVYLLKKARLGRGHVKDNKIFSFSHRRIAEYFYVQTLLQDNEKVDLESIPTIGKQRDALVLYSEVSDIEKAKEIANYCWNNIQESESILNKRSVNSLRFLVEAFRNRTQVLKDFREELSKFILTTIESEKNILILKLSIEALGLLDEDNIDKGVSDIFKLNNSWLNETATVSCRHLNNISKKLKQNIEDYIYNMGYEKFFPSLSSLLFSFSLSDAFIKFKRMCYLKIIDLIVFIPALILYIYLQFFWDNVNTMYLLISIGIISVALLIYGFTINYFKYLFLSLFLMFSIQIIGKQTFTTEDFLLLLSTLLMGFPFTKLSFSFDDFLRLKETINKNIFLIILMVLMFFLLIYYKVNMNESLLPYGYIGFSLLYVSYWFFFKYFSLKDIFTYKKINLKKLDNRTYIYNTYVSIQSYYYKMKLVKYLEDNVQNAFGEWPHNDILEIHSKPNIRLARLEEKWLKLNR